MEFPCVRIFLEENGVFTMDIGKFRRECQGATDIITKGSRMPGDNFKVFVGDIVQE